MHRELVELGQGVLIDIVGVFLVWCALALLKFCGKVIADMTSDRH